MSNIARGETNSRGFLDRKSKIMRDGREILGPKDWKLRVAELIKRATGNYSYPRCEYRFQTGRGMQRCIQSGVWPCHVVPRKDLTQRDDRMDNLKWYCVAHANLTEGQSWRRTRFGEHSQPQFGTIRKVWA